MKSDDPVEVIIEFIMENGELPTEGIIHGLQLYLENEQIRPLTDKVKVKAPDTVDYKLDVKYYINTSDLKRADTIKTNVAAAVEKYIIWQRNKIGRDINPSQLIQMMVAAGASSMYKRLKRLYLADRLTDAALQTAVKRGWITDEEKEEIIEEKKKTAE